MTLRIDICSQLAIALGPKSSSESTDRGPGGRGRQLSIVSHSISTCMRINYNGTTLLWRFKVDLEWCHAGLKYRALN